MPSACEWSMGILAFHPLDFVFSGILLLIDKCVDFDMNKKQTKQSNIQSIKSKHLLQKYIRNTVKLNTRRTFLYVKTQKFK